MQTVQERLRGLREDNDLSQEELAKLLGTSQTMYSRYERGATDIPVRHLIVLCRFFNVSADYFTKMFKDSIGKTPIEYINGLRVNRSMELLFKTEKSMSEIADEIGFCNPNYFHKIFKQYTDQSPLAYRKSTK